jgi:hypothetical protein
LIVGMCEIIWFTVERSPMRRAVERASTAEAPQPFLGRGC